MQNHPGGLDFVVWLAQRRAHKKLSWQLHDEKTLSLRERTKLKPLPGATRSSSFLLTLTYEFQIVAENVWTPGHDSHLSNVGVIEVIVEVIDVPDVPPFWVKAPPLTVLSGMDRMQKTLFIDFERLRHIGHVALQLRYFSDPFLYTHAYIFKVTWPVRVAQNGPNVSELLGPVVFPSYLPSRWGKCIETTKKWVAIPCTFH